MGDKSWRFDDLERKYVEEVLSSGFVASTSGSMNTRLEEAFAQRLGREFAITFNSGTTTLHTALWALGVGYGDEVLVPAATVISCMNAVLYCNAIPVFVDIEEDSLNIDTTKTVEKGLLMLITLHMFSINQWIENYMQKY